MKQESLQHMLSRYKDGTLSDEETEQLNRLTHRDEVFAKATDRAHSIIVRRTRRIVGLSITSAVLLGAGIWAVAGNHKEAGGFDTDGQMIAMAEEQITELPQTINAEMSTSAEETTKPTNIQTLKHSNIQTLKRSNIEVATSQPTASNQPMNGSKEDETVVMCNNQCNADSVISDIWKFLSA